MCGSERSPRPADRWLFRELLDSRCLGLKKKFLSSMSPFTALHHHSSYIIFKHSLNGQALTDRAEDNFLLLFRICVFQKQGKRFVTVLFVCGLVIGKCF